MNNHTRRCLWAVGLMIGLMIGLLSTPGWGQANQAAPYPFAHDPLADEIRSWTPGAQTLQQAPALDLALRGELGFILSAENTELRLTVTKQDINWQAGAETLSFTLRDDFGHAVATGEIGDDGVTSARSQPGPLLEETFAITLPEAGTYRLQFNGSLDQRYQLETNAPAWGVQASLEVFNSRGGTTFYFIAPPNQVVFDVFTQHAAGLNQNVVLRNSRGGQVASAFIGAVDQQFALSASVPADEAGSIWQLHLPMQDLVIRSREVDYLFTQRATVFDFGFTQQLIQPRSLRQAGLSGDRVRYHFRLSNTRNQPIELFPQVSAMQPASLEIELPSSPVRIPGASHVFVDVYANLPAELPVGATGSFLLTLRDEQQTPLTQARALFDVAEPHPLPAEPRYVLFSSQRAQRIRERAQNGSPAMRAIAASLQSYAQRVVADNLPVRSEEAGWMGRYVCDGLGDGDNDDDDGSGAPLVFNVHRPDLHICSTSGERYRGERYDEAWLARYNQELGNRLRFLGYAYLVHQQPEAAGYVRDLLTGYATRYLTWPLNDFQGTQLSFSARLHVETLTESMWLINAAIGYALTRHDPVYSAADRAHIEHNLLIPAAEIILNNPMGPINWQSWHSTAIGLAGYITQNEDWVETALGQPHGWAMLREEALRDDGIWQEGSIGYHYFGMQPLPFLLTAAEAHGRVAFDDRFELAMVSPLDLLYPSGYFPNLNDSINQRITLRRVLYEQANARYENPVFDRVLTFLYETMGESRSNFDTLLFGEPYQSEPLAVDASLKDQMGLAVPRSGNRLTDQIAVMDYGPHGLTHGQFDKLHLSLFGQGTEWLTDPGVGSSNDATFDTWFRTTLGHNTIMLGEQTQRTDNEDNRDPVLFESRLSDWQVMRATMGEPVYPSGAVADRTVLVAGRDYALVLDEVTGGPAPRDFIFHLEGDLLSPTGFSQGQPPARWQDSPDGHRFLEAPRLVSDPQPQSILMQTTEDGVVVQSQRRFGFTDRCEFLELWSGNLGLANDAAEGRHAIQWVVVPREFQTMQKEFLTLSEETPIPDQLQFEVRIESDQFDRLTLVLENAIPGERREYVITRGESVTPGSWQTVTVDLDDDTNRFNTGLRVHRLQFGLSGAIGSDDAFRIWVDDIRALAGGAVIEGERRGVALHFPGGEATQYFLADGPSPQPPRTHPVVIARRGQTGPVRHAAVIEPFLGAHAIQRTETLDANNLLLESEAWRDQIALDPAALQYRRLRTHPQTGQVMRLDGIGPIDWQHEALRYQSPGGAFSLERLDSNPLEQRWRYHKAAPAPDQLQLSLNSGQAVVWLDGQPWPQARIEAQPSGPWLIAENLPPGMHRIEITPDAQTRIENWAVFE